MTSEEIENFANEVYRQCVDKGMTCKDFRLFAHFIEVRKQRVASTLYKQTEKLALPNPLDIV